MPNLLHEQKSPYLRQHSGQEIHWMTWSKEALHKAKQENKPLLISIGYSACHWCQTMSRQNFEDSYIASLMNRHFVCVLVDREERPDLDYFYMEAVRMFDQSAGWPLHVFCLPSGEPFWGGTFFPKEDIGQGIAPWPQVLIRISQHFQEQPEDLIENAQNVTKNLKHANHADCAEINDWSNALLVDAVNKFDQLHEDEHGGFTTAPKFPAGMKIDFLLAFSETDYARRNNSLSKRINFCIEKTLSSMALGGIYDQLEGGFFRYSIDSNWSIPHFEKIIAENALLISTYSRANRKFHSTLYRKVVRETIDWMISHLRGTSGGFVSSVSSESDELEGKIYLWEEQELNEILGTQAANKMISSIEGIRDGETIFYLPRLGEDKELNQELEHEIFPKLNAFRKKRIPHPVDEKKRVSTNALALKALVDAGISLKDKKLLLEACKQADWMNDCFCRKDEIDSIEYGDGKKQKFDIPPNLDDYAFWVEALLYLAAFSELVVPDSSEDYLEEAKTLVEQCIDLFRDEKGAGYFFSESQLCPPLPVRKKFWYDNAIPSGNSTLLRVFCLLLVFTGEQRWKTEYLKARAAYPKIAQKNPEGIAYALSAISEEATGIAEITIPRKYSDETLNELAQHPHRSCIVRIDDSEQQCLLEVGGNCFSYKTVKEAFEALFG